MTDTKKTIKRVTRTKKLMEAGKQLREYRDKIDDIIKVISSGEEFHSDIANDVINIGVNIQRLTKILRPLSVEGQEKKNKRNTKRRWKRMVEKNRTELGEAEFNEWMKTYSETYRWDPDRYIGPNEAFHEDYVKGSKTNT